MKKHQKYRSLSVHRKRFGGKGSPSRSALKQQIHKRTVKVDHSFAVALPSPQGHSNITVFLEIITLAMPEQDERSPNL